MTIILTTEQAAKVRAVLQAHFIGFDDEKEALDILDSAQPAPKADDEVVRLIKAVGDLVKAKGRYHTEQNYKAVAAFYAALAAKGIK